MEDSQDTYSFPIPNKNSLMYQLFAYGIILVNLAAQFLLAENRLVYAVAMAVIFVLIILIDVYRFRKTGGFQPVGIVILALAAKWFMAGIYWAFFLNLLLWFLYIIARRKLLIHISKHGVEYPSFPKKRIEWADLNNVMLKDDILTIDCKNNKIYQPLVQYSDQYANEQDFNDFCRNQLAK